MFQRIDKQVVVNRVGPTNQQIMVLKRVEWTALILSALFLGVSILGNDKPKILACLGCLIWYISLPLLIKKPGDFQIRLTACLGGGVGATLYTIVNDGFLNSPVFPWLLIFPVIAAILGSRSQGWAWLGVCLAANLLVAVLDPSFPTRFSAKNLDQVLNVPILMIFLGSICIVFRTLADSEAAGRALAEQETKDINLRFQYMIQGNNNALWDWMDMSRNEVYWSPQLYEILGYRDLEIPSTVSTFFEHIAEEDRQWTIEAMNKAIEAGDRLSSIIRLVHKKGHIIWVRSSGFVVRNKEGTPIRMVGSLEDLTELKENQIALQEAKNIAEQANAAKSRFLSQMSHELRTPLHGIVGYGELLMQSSLDPIHEKNAAIIVDCSLSLIKLINDILDYAKIESGHIIIESENINIHEIAEDVANLFALSIKQKGLQFQLTSNIKGKLFKINSLRLRQILINLIGNAIKFTNQGEVTLDLSEIPSEDSMSAISIQVRDTGIGFRQEDQEQIFEAFQHATSQRNTDQRGAGLGLTIVRQLVQLMGGEISIQSSPGKGSAFTVNLNLQPIVEKDREKILLTNESTEIKLLQSILIADDSELNRTLMVTMLAFLGMAADSVADGEEVINALNHKSYDLVLMDINMPNLNGLEATKKIRELYPTSKIKIYGLSANAFQEDKEKALAAGMNDYLTKPVTIDQIRHILVTSSPKG